MLIFVLIFVGKRIRQTLKTLYISRFFRFVLIILYSHSYATHLLEDDVNVFYIQRLLGHATLWTTMRYLRISMTDMMKTKSPFDKLMELENARNPIGNL